MENHLAAAFSISELFKGLEIKMGSVSPLPDGYLRLCLDIKQPADPVRVTALTQYAQTAMADRKITMREFLGLAFLAMS